VKVIKRIALIALTILLIATSAYFPCRKFFKFCQKSRIYLNLKSQIEEESKNAPGHISFVIKDLTFPSLELSCLAREKFPAASLIKVPILASVLQAVETGRLSLEQQVTITQADLTGGSGKIKTLKLPINVTLQELLEFMISHSDNTASNKIIDLLGFDYLNESFKKAGLKDTVLKRRMMDFSQRPNGKENYTSARDIVFLLNKIYAKKLINKEFSQIALSLLKKQRIKDRIPRYLPKNIIVAHKTGLEHGIVHDAGIVFAPQGDYIICVLMKKSHNYKAAKKFIAQVSLLTYNFYE